MLRQGCDDSDQNNPNSGTQRRQSCGRGPHYEKLVHDSSVPGLTQACYAWFYHCFSMHWFKWTTGCVGSSCTHTKYLPCWNVSMMMKMSPDCTTSHTSCGLKLKWEKTTTSIRRRAQRRHQTELRYVLHLQPKTWQHKESASHKLSKHDVSFPLAAPANVQLVIWGLFGWLSLVMFEVEQRTKHLYRPHNNKLDLPLNDIWLTHSSTHMHICVCAGAWTACASECICNLCLLQQYSLQQTAVCRVYAGKVKPVWHPQSGQSCDTFAAAATASLCDSFYKRKTEAKVYLYQREEKTSDSASISDIKDGWHTSTSSHGTRLRRTYLTHERW